MKNFMVITDAQSITSATVNLFQWLKDAQDFYFSQLRAGHDVTMMMRFNSDEGEKWSVIG